MTLRKILNVHSAERNEHFFKLESFENIVAKEEIAPAPVTIFSNVVCCMLSATADLKTSIYGVKG